jgi:hypothetical protein
MVALANKPGKSRRRSCHHGTTDPTLLKKKTRHLATTSHANATSLATTQTGRLWPRHHNATNTIEGRNHHKYHGSTAAWPHHSRGIDRARPGSVTCTEASPGCHRSEDATTIEALKKPRPPPASRSTADARPAATSEAVRAEPSHAPADRGSRVTPRTVNDATRPRPCHAPTAERSPSLPVCCHGPDHNVEPR